MKKPIWPITAVLTALTVCLAALKTLGMISLSWLWVIAAWWLPGALMLIGLLVGHLLAGKRAVGDKAGS